MMPLRVAAQSLLCAVAISFCGVALAAPATVSVERFGARGDGTTMNTTSIQQAIDAAAQSHGIVTFPAGVYLTGSLFVKSGMTLRVDKGVTLMGSEHLEDYPLRPTRVAGIEMTWPAALLNVYQQTNAAITGEGTIDGNGKVWWDSYWALRKAYDPKGLRWAADYDSKRPRLIVVYDSSNVTVGGGLQLRRSGFWTVQVVYSHDITVDGVTIRNNEGGHGPSTDGIDIDSSRRILVAHADIENNDDAICLKAGRDADGLRVNRPTEDVVIRDSIIRVGAAGVTFGSETSGGFRNIEIYNLRTLGGVPSGILFKSSSTRGGFGENIRIHDLVMEDTKVVLRMTMDWNPNYSHTAIPAGLADYPSYYRTLTTPVPQEKGIAHFHDVHIWNIRASGAKLVFDVNGNPKAPVERFRVEHVEAQAESAGRIAYARDWMFSGLQLRIADGSSVALVEATNITGLPRGGKGSDPAQKTPAFYEK